MDDAELIRSPQNAKLKLVRALRAGKDRQHVLLEGARVLDDALQALKPEWLLHVPDLQGKALRALDAARASGVPCFACDAALLAQGSDLDSAPGLLAVAQRPQFDPSEILAEIAAQQGLLLVAAGVQDPGNVGAMVRVAAGLGVHAILFLTGGASPWHPRALRGATGTTFRLPVLEGLAIEEFLALIAQHGFQLAGTTTDGMPCDEFKPSGPMALLLGEEGRGLAPELANACQQMVGIPLQRGVESLNVATAAAILVQQFMGRISGSANRPAS